MSPSTCSKVFQATNLDYFFEISRATLIEDMELHFFNTENWYDINKKSRKFFLEELGFSGNFEVRTYLDMSQAVYEITQGLAQFYVHKRHFIIQEGISPYLHHIGRSLLRNAYIQAEIPKELQSTISLRSWGEVEKKKSSEIIENLLKKDTLVFLAALDHPVMGFSYPWHRVAEVFDQKKIFQVYLQHNFHSSFEVSPYHVHIIQGKDYVFGLLGERFKAPPLFTDMHPWVVNQNTSQPIDHFIESEFEVLRLRKKSLNESTLNQARIEAHEKNWPMPFPEIQLHERVFDRSLILLERISSSACVGNIKAQFPQYSTQVKTLDMCGLAITEDKLQWWDFGAPRKDLWRLLILDLVPSLDPQFIAWLKTQDSQARDFEFPIKL